MTYWQLFDMICIQKITAKLQMPRSNFVQIIHWYTIVYNFFCSTARRFLVPKILLHFQVIPAGFGRYSLGGLVCPKQTVMLLFFFTSVWLTKNHGGNRRDMHSVQTGRDPPPFPSTTKPMSLTTESKFNQANYDYHLAKILFTSKTNLR